MVDNFGGFPAIGGLDGGVFSPVSNLDLGSEVSVTVVAIKSFSNGVISMFKGEIRVMDAETAEDLIENGLVATYAPVVPEVGENDKDKYLHTNAETGNKEWSIIPSELPTVLPADKDKYLHTNAETGNKEWSNIPSELPTVLPADKDKYLHTNESTGAIEWSEVSGGGAEEVVYYVKNTDVISGSTVTKIYKNSACTQEFTSSDATALKTKLDNGAKLIFKVGTSNGYVNPTFVQYILTGSVMWHLRAGIVWFDATGAQLVNAYLDWNYDNT